MRPFTGQAMFVSVLLYLGSCYAYMEALAANTDVDLGKFEPEVAFICNKPAMHRVVNGWEPDFTTDCIEDPKEILNYCKKVYPDHDIKTVVELTHSMKIANWPKFDGPESSKLGNHDVTPYRCLVKEFESEALLVPQHCVFDHEHDQSKCERPSFWIKRASDECANQDMMLKDSGMLVLCDVDMFRGVEYVCCPKEDSEELSSESDEDQTADSGESKQDDYTRYLHGDEMKTYSNEHAKFKAAEKVMKKHEHDKITKMMKDWQEARDQVAEMRKADKQGAEALNKDIAERFQRMYHAYEQEAAAEKKQLVALHQQRVQAMFNKKKRMLLDSYVQEVESDSPVASKVLSYLKLYIRVEEKDRLHTVNFYEHKRDTDPAEALRVREELVRHLNLIDERIQDAINILKRVPELEKKITPVVESFRKEKFRRVEISMMDIVLPAETTPKPQGPVEVIPINEASEESESSQHDYTNIKIDSEDADSLTVQEANHGRLSAFAMNNGASVQQQSFSSQSATKSSNSANFVGIGIGSVAVFIIVVVAVVMVRKRNRRQPITHGFVEVDPAASPEERHVANMQMNGYENPTYKYFEIGTN